MGTLEAIRKEGWKGLRRIMRVKGSRSKGYEEQCEKNGRKWGVKKGRKGERTRDKI